MFINLLKKFAITETRKMVFLVRTDLGRGKIASQVAHAAILLYKNAVRVKNPHLGTWLLNGQPKIVLKVTFDFEATMKHVYQQAVKNNLNACMVHDSGRTQVECGTLTVIGIGPDLVEEVDKITGNFKLL